MQRATESDQPPPKRLSSSLHPETPKRRPRTASTGPRARARAFVIAERARAFWTRHFPEAAAEHWNDWTWQLRHRFRDLPGLERIVRHCLEKNPEERFHSAHDLAFDLEALSTTSPASGAAKAVSDARRTGMGRSALAAAAAAALALAFYGGTRMHAGGAALDNVQFRRLTFRRGNIMSARFAPDGQTVVFGAAWEGKPAEVFTLRVDSPESRPFGLLKADVAAVSSHGELAALLVNRSAPGELGTLARLPLGGGAPREVLEKVLSADFSPDGKDLAVIREMPDGKPRLEFPIGHALYDAFYIFRPRVSPSGDLVAFQARAADGTTAIRVADRRGQSREISVGMVINSGIAWSPDGKEIVTSGRVKEGEGPYAIDLSGEKRMLLPGTGLLLHDVAHDGRILIERTVGRTGILVGTDGGGPERDLGWLDQSVLGDISEDRRALLITEVGEGGGAEGTVYLRPIDGGAAVRLGEGEGTGLTPDGKWALTMRTGKPLSVFLLPTGPGSPRPVPLEGVDPNFAVLMTDGKHIGLYIGQPGQPPQLAIVGLEGGKPKPFALPGMSATRGFADSPGMRSIAYADANGKVLISDGTGAPPRTVPGPGLAPDEHILRWTDDPRKIFLSAVENLEGKFFKLDIATGEKTPWKTFHPADPSGVFRVGQGWLTPDGKTYAYSYLRVEASDLYEVRGLLPGRH